MLKTIILIGGPSKGTRFRPLSMDIPKPLFPVAGFPMIYHHIEAASKVPDMKEVLIIGSYQQSDQLQRFIAETQASFHILIRYLQEYAALGTAGGMYHFRDQILSGSPELMFVMNCDVCGEFPLQEMLDFHRGLGAGPHHTVLGTEATRQQAQNYGCLVEDPSTHQVCHYVEKPETFVSSTINCGIYLFHPDIFTYIGKSFNSKQEQICYSLEGNNTSNAECVRLEQDIFADQLASLGCLYVFHTNNFWSQIKNAGAAIYANRHYLNMYERKYPERLSRSTEGGPTITGQVFIHPTATVHPSAKLGPNVTVGKGVEIGEGVRVRESIILQGAILQAHCCVLHSVIGWKSVIGKWSRVEGTPNDPNPNKPFAKLDNPDLFNSSGRLNPAITVIGSSVKVPAEVIVLNSIVLPHKDLGHSCKNQILL